MFNDNAFPNAGSITGSGGALVSSGIFVYLDYGQSALYSIAPFYNYTSGQNNYAQVFQSNSITGSGGALAPSGIFVYLDYLLYAQNEVFPQLDSQDSTGTAPIISPFKPYAYFYKKY